MTCPNPCAAAGEAMALLSGLGVLGGILAALLAYIAIWAPRRPWIKLTALATATCLLPLAYAGFAELLGRPKPVVLPWASIEAGTDQTEATVLAARLQEGEAIYLWLGFDGLNEPRSYALPWNEALARELHGAQGEAKQTGTALRARLPLRAELPGEEPLFYAAPQPVPPPKAEAAEDPLWFQGAEPPSEG